MLSSTLQFVYNLVPAAEPQLPIHIDFIFETKISSLKLKPIYWPSKHRLEAPLKCSPLKINSNPATLIYIHQALALVLMYGWFSLYDNCLNGWKVIEQFEL